MSSARPGRAELARVIHGSHEPIFQALPARVLANLRSPASENALCWNLIYPLAQPDLEYRALMALRPLWGTALDAEDDLLRPYFWGFNVLGERMPGLGDGLRAVDGPGNATEVDLILLGRKNLVLAEVKNTGHLGRCGRYARGRCPEIHTSGASSESGCRYWDEGPARFSVHLEFGGRPSPGVPSPPCNDHYQLARTLQLGTWLAKHHGLHLHLWLITPRRRWPAHRRSWEAFAERVREDALWRRCRVLAWEDMRALASG